MCQQETPAWPAKAASKAATPKNANTAKRGGQSKKPAAALKKRGALDAAVLVLKDAKEPMRSLEMVEGMFARKLWASDGQTPHATLYAAIIREIAQKGKESRFEKVDRGRFRLQKGVA